MSNAPTTRVTPSDFGKVTTSPTPDSVALEAKPPTRDPDWAKLGKKVSARYPRILAELAK